MDEVRLSQVLNELEIEQGEAAREMDLAKHRYFTHKARFDALGQAMSAIQGLLGMEPVLSGVDNAHIVTKRDPLAPQRPQGPRGVEAVRRVLVEIGEELSVADIAAELVERGWIKSNNPVNATFSSAARAAEVLPDVDRRRDESGLYLYRYVGIEERVSSEALANAAGVDAKDEDDPVFEDDDPILEDDADEEGAERSAEDVFGAEDHRFNEPTNMGGLSVTTA